MDYAALKTATVKDDNIATIDNFQFYVNHTEKLATLCFLKGEDGTTKLKKYADDIRFDAGTIKLMKERYRKFYPNN